MGLTRRQRMRTALLLGDLALASLTLSVLVLTSLGFGVFVAAPATLLLGMAAYPVLQLAALHVCGLHAPTLLPHRGWDAARLGVALVPGHLWLALAGGLGGVTFEPVRLAAHFAALLSLLFGTRCLARAWAQLRARKRGLGIVADLAAVTELIGRVNTEPLAEFAVRRVCVPTAEKLSPAASELELDGIEVTDEPGKLLGSRDLDGIVLDGRCAAFRPAEVIQLADLAASGTRVYDYVAFHDAIAGRFPASLDASAVAHGVTAHGRASRLYGAAKRALDVVVGSAMLLLTAVPMLAIALIIKLDSPGPALLAQSRVGYRRRVFRCIKFRTMAVDAASNGPAWTEKNDQRITRVGHALRKLRLDELPQLFNVVRGDMSLVGPRPILETVVESLVGDAPLYDVRHTVRPGLTGWAQVEQGYAAGAESERAKLQYDLHYLRERSFGFDLFILLRTVQTVLGGNGR